jgi:molecular chaperone GrpE
MVKESNQNQEDIKKTQEEVSSEEAVNAEIINEEVVDKEHAEVDEATDDTEKPKKKKSRKARKDADEIEELKLKNAELNDKFLRLFSEFDNFRKRTLRERIELTKTASQEVIISMLPVLDDFDRATKALEETDNIDSFKEGINLIHNKLKTTLTAKGLHPMKSKGETFDTDFHEAITEIPAPDKSMKGKIIDEVEKGYLLGDKVIRYAKVVVGS